MAHLCLVSQSIAAVDPDVSVGFVSKPSQLLLGGGGIETYSASTLPFWSSSARVRFRGIDRDRSRSAYSYTSGGYREHTR
jgi:hypothetical protein